MRNVRVKAALRRHAAWSGSATSCHGRNRLVSVCRWPLAIATLYWPQVTGFAAAKHPTGGTNPSTAAKQNFLPA